MKFRYYVSYFAKLNAADNGLGIAVHGHFGGRVIEVSHAINTQDDIDRLTQYLQKKEGNPKMWTILLQGFSLMYVYDENLPEDNK